MRTSREQYNEMVKKTSPNSPHLQHWLLSFLVGGAICALGEGVALIYKALGCDEEQVKIMVPCTFVLLAAIFTAFGVFDELGKYAGAGTAVPITGFSNSIVSAAMEHRSEGFILGVGANMFKLAGPVLVYGSAVCTIYGAIYYIMQM